MEDSDENNEMAAMMGFTDFGGSKKRKFDHAKSTPEDEYSASGANSTELGVRTKISSTQQSSGEEDIYTASNSKKASPAGGLASFLARGQALPDKPPTPRPVQQDETRQEVPPASDIISFGGASILRADLNALRFGVKNAEGDIAYFLPSFVEDPWEILRPTRTRT